ncbi:Predicted unusual protein kinase [alpha proteobacterium BAL199]|jgi:ubiquinone biosynthesis protein|nr:Predicted unusual protein kinase [alpha proteobacterium BAL199]
MIRALRNLFRLIRIAWILARHGVLEPLEAVAEAPALALIARLSRRLRDRDVSGRWGERLAAALVALGPSFIKLGQSLATRADLIGDQASADLTMLQDRLPPFPPDVARATLEHELEASVADLFQRFDDAPVAAASIAQVHRARTSDGHEVAVKILRPGIELAVARDLDLFEWVAETVEHLLPWTERLRPIETVQVFRQTVEMEMDLRFEAAAAAELAENFVGSRDFRVASVDWSHTTRRVLTCAWIDGCRIDDTAALSAAGVDPTDLLAKAAGVFFNQVFRDGFFHADMHPGNMLVETDGTLVPVDFGIMGRVDLATRFYLADTLTGFLNGDWHAVADIHFRMGFVPAHKSIDLFTQACRSIGEPLIDKPLHEVSVAKLLGQVLRIAETFEMRAQPQLLLLHKTMVVSEGVGRRLNPNVNMWALARPLIEQWMIENRGPEALLARSADDIARAITRLPALVRAADRMLQHLDEGGLKVHPESLRIYAELHAPARFSSWPIWAAVIAGLLLGLLIG